MTVKDSSRFHPTHVALWLLALTSMVAGGLPLQAQASAAVDLETGLAAVEGLGSSIFADGFEDGVVSTWSTATPVLFRSKFEDSVSLEPPFHDGGGTWFQRIVGQDGEGFRWPMSIWGAEGLLQVLVDSSLPVGQYFDNRIETTPGHLGGPTRALHLNQLKKAAGFTQVPYIFFTDGVEGGDIYLSYWLRFPSDLATILGPDGWFLFLEWKTCCNDYRIASYIYEGLGGDLYWHVHGDNETNSAPVYEQYWEAENHDLPVPAGDWFHVEVFLHRSSGADGRFWWAIDDQVIVDRWGANRKVESFNRFMPFTLYTNAQSIDLWVDDIEIWDRFPQLP